MANNPGLWDEFIAKKFEEFVIANQADIAVETGGHWLHYFRVYANGNYDTSKSGDDFLEGARKLYDLNKDDEALLNKWEQYLKDNTLCYCEATEDPAYLYT